MTALVETQKDGDEKYCPLGEGTQKFVLVSSSYSDTPASPLDVYVKYIV